MSYNIVMAPIILPSRDHTHPPVSGWLRCNIVIGSVQAELLLDFGFTLPSLLRRATYGPVYSLALCYLLYCSFLLSFVLGLCP